jgi:alanyl aminopeptidase
MGFAQNVHAAYAAGLLDGPSALALTLPFVTDPYVAVAASAMPYYRDAFRWLQGDPLLGAVQTRARGIYRPTFDALAAKPAPKETVDDQLLRRSLALFLAEVGNDQEIREHARRLAAQFLGLGGDGKIHREVVGAEQIGAVLQIAGEGADAALFDALLAHLGTEQHEDLRGHLVRAAGAALDPALAERARALSLGDRLNPAEMLQPLVMQMGHPVTRRATWEWVKKHADELLARMPPRVAGAFPKLAAELCDEGDAADVRAVFGPRLARLPGGRRALDNAVEAIELCLARKKAQLPALRSLFAGAK